MKKGLLAIAAAGLLVVVSCKKDHTCSCTVTSSGSLLGDFTVTADTIFTDMKKKDAQSACEGMNASYSAGGESTTVACELK